MAARSGEPAATISSVFSSGSTPLTTAEAAAVVLQAYGLTGEVTLLTSERDQNFLVKCEDPAAAFVLKVTHPDEARDVTDFQTQAQLRLMAATPPLPVPRLIPGLDGEPVYWLCSASGESRRAVRLSTFLPGRALHTVPRTAALGSALGDILGRFDAALSGFRHPGAAHVLLWDLQHAASLRPLLEYIEAGPRHALAAAALARFESHVLPRLSTLRRQVIHNDLNPYNVFMDEAGDTVTGIIDFGDMVEAPLIDELGVACSYQFLSGEAPLAMAAACVQAYHARIPLQDDELALLPDLIATRLLLTVLITTWRASLYPENSRYILRNNPPSWQGLEILQTLEARSPLAAQTLFRRACGMP